MAGNLYKDKKLTIDEILELARQGAPIKAYQGNEEGTEYTPSFFPKEQSIDEIDQGQEMVRDIKDSQVGAPVQGGLVQNFTSGTPKPPEDLLTALRQSSPSPERPQFMGMDLEDVQKVVSRLKGGQAKGIPDPESQAPSAGRGIMSNPGIETAKEEITKENPDYSGLFNSQEDLLQSQDASNSNNLLTNLARAGTQIGSGIAFNSRPDYSTIDAIAKTNDQPLDAYKARIAGITQDQKINEGKMDLDNLQALQDPNHPISKAAREAASKYLKITLPDDVSAGQLEKAGLLKPLLGAVKGPGGSSRQIIRGLDAEGNVRNYLIDKASGETTDLGEAGFAAQTRVDPNTGELIQILPNRTSNNVTALANPKMLGGKQDARMLTGEGQPEVEGTPSTPSEEPGKPRLSVRQQEKTNDAIKRAQNSEEFKASEKMLTSTSKIRKLLKDAKAHGGQSLAMLGPQVARGIAGEVGVLTNPDVIRYVQNPTLIGNLQDTFLRLSEGKLSEQSVENLTRLLDIMETESKRNRDDAYSKSATQLNRLYGVPVDQANYIMNPSIDARSPQGGPQVLSNEKQQRVDALRAKLLKN